MLINGIEYKEVKAESSSCIGCDLLDRSANRGHGQCKNPEVVCIGLNRQDRQDVQFKRVK
jgi:hypothetical protein